MDHRINLKECEKKDKYLDLVRELKKLWNMKVTIVPTVISAFGTITKELLKGLEDLEVGGRIETIQMIALLRTARIRDEPWRLEETCCHSSSCEKSSANTDVKNSKGVNNKLLLLLLLLLLFYSFESFFTPALANGSSLEFV